MPCASCDTRQSDPARGPSAWRRLVRFGEQVLICPACAARPGWDDDADRCAACGSTTLRKALGVVRCGACGATAEPDHAEPDRSRQDVGLSREIDAALDRLFGRRPGADA